MPLPLHRHPSLDAQSPFSQLKNSQGTHLPLSHVHPSPHSPLVLQLPAHLLPVPTQLPFWHSQPRALAQSPLVQLSLEQSTHFVFRQPQPFPPPPQPLPLVQSPVHLSDTHLSFPAQWHPLAHPELQLPQETHTHTPSILLHTLPSLVHEAGLLQSHFSRQSPFTHI